MNITGKIIIVSVNNVWFLCYNKYNFLGKTFISTRQDPMCY